MNLVSGTQGLEMPAGESRVMAKESKGLTATVCRIDYNAQQSQYLCYHCPQL